MSKIVDTEKLAEEIHDNSDGEDCVGYIESMLDLLEEHDPERFQEFVKDYEDDDIYDEDDDDGDD